MGIPLNYRDGHGEVVRTAVCRGATCCFRCVGRRRGRGRTDEGDGYLGLGFWSQREGGNVPAWNEFSCNV